jgi:hypothetical protein
MPTFYQSPNAQYRKSTKLLAVLHVHRNTRPQQSRAFIF